MKAKQTAETREAETRAVLDFMTNRIFAAARPEGVEGGLGRDVTLRQALNEALPFLENAFRDQPLIEAKLRMTLGLSYYFLGDDTVARDQIQAARSLYSLHASPDDPDALWSASLLAMTYNMQGRHAEAAKLNEETLARRRAKLGPDHPYTLWSMNNLAETYFEMGRYAEALQRGKETLALRQAKLGPNHRETLMSLQIVADSYAALGQGAAAISHYDELLKQWEARLGPDHPEMPARLNQLAWILSSSDTDRRDPRRAVALAQRAVKLEPEVGAWWQTLAVAHYHAGDWQAAVAALDKSISLGRGADDRCLDWFVLAMAHWQLGDKAEARKWYDQGTEWLEKNRVSDRKLQHFRSEAAELLGIKQGARKWFEQGMEWIRENSAGDETTQ